MDKMTEKARVGLIGVGLMGHGIGKNILAKGYPLAVLAHRNRAPVEDLVRLGAREAATPRAMAESCDAVILCVTGSPQVEETVYGSNGILAGLRPGLVIADCTTAEPSSTRKIAAEIVARGGRFADTPMVRTPKEAEAGKLALMVGGEKPVIEELRPILSCFADTIVYAGPVGTAHALKLVNNFIALGTAAVVAEAIVTAAKSGVDMKALRDIVTSGGGNSVMFERLIKVPLEDDDTAAKFAISNARKDLRYYTAIAEQLPVAAFLAEAVHQTFVLAENLGYGSRYIARLIDALNSVNRPPK
jgi:3-hydroxyisobutyrate dehydrogenase-like beta-hydroxyacid dehydrogenase